MCFCHFVVNGDEVFVLNFFGFYFVCFVGFFCFQCRQGNAATADHRVAGGVDDVAAKGADVEFGAQHISGNVSVYNFRPRSYHAKAADVQKHTCASFMYFFLFCKKEYGHYLNKMCFAVV